MVQMYHAMDSCSAKAPEGWIQDPNGQWSMRFHRDQKVCFLYPYVFIDKGRTMQDGSPALLKSRLHLPKCDAIELWKSLRAVGWKRVSPQWGLDLDP